MPLLWSCVAAPGAIDVLLAVPYDDLVPCPVREKMFEALARLECGSGSRFNLHLGLIDDWEPTLPEDLGRRAAIARLRNHLLDTFLKPEQCDHTTLNSIPSRCEFSLSVHCTGANSLCGAVQ